MFTEVETHSSFGCMQACRQGQMDARNSDSFGDACESPIQLSDE
jgi:hypothetical protein